MTISFLTSEVLPKLRRVASVVSQKNSIQILSDICMTVKGQNLMLTASDGNIWLTERASLVSVDSDTSFCVLASDFLNVMNNLGDVNATIELDAEKKKLTCRYGKGHFSMPYESAEEYPHPLAISEDAAEVFVSGTELCNGIRLCKIATATNDVLRPQLNGVNFNFSEGDMVCTSTDTFIFTRYIGRGIANANRDRVNFTLTQKVMSVANAVLKDEEVKLTVTDSKLVISSKDYKITASLIEGTYPNCERFISRTNEMVGTIDRESLIHGLNRVIAMGDTRNTLVKMNVSRNELNISAEDFEYSKSATETIECNLDIAEGFTIGLKGTLLIELLKCIDDEVVGFEMSSPVYPIFVYGTNNIKKDNYFSLLMPVKL